MDKLVNLGNYLEENFGSGFDIKVKSKTNNLPLYISKKYTFLTVGYMSVEYIGVLVDFEDSIGYKEIEYLLNTISKDKSELSKYILVFERISHYLRKKLIEKKIQFVIINMQIFIPNLGMIYYKAKQQLIEKTESQKEYKFTPSEQSIVLYLIINRKEKFSIQYMASELNLSAMSISRAAKALYLKEILIQSGPSNKLEYSINGTFETLYLQGRDHFINPVSKVLYLPNSYRDELQAVGTISGESRLAQISMLNKPTNESLAIEEKRWRDFSKKNPFEFVMTEKDDCTIVEVYKHKVFMDQDKKLHPILVVLSLQDHHDERIHNEVEQIKRNIEKELEYERDTKI